MSPDYSAVIDRASTDGKFGNYFDECDPSQSTVVEASGPRSRASWQGDQQKDECFENFAYSLGQMASHAVK